MICEILRIEKKKNRWIIFLFALINKEKQKLKGDKKKKKVHKRNHNKIVCLQPSICCKM